jgi:uncharacterized repeat protein (TIGR01451 family)
MKFQYKHAFAIALLVFLAVAPAVAALTNPQFTPAQEEEDILELILNEGAEVVFSHIDDQGVPGVIYGQLGIPSDALALDDPMYDGCLAMALVSTHGEFIEMVLDLVGADLFGGEAGMMSASGLGPLQDDMGFNPEDILELIGTEFNLLVNIFVDVEEATSQQRMSSIMNHLSTQFQFSFAELFTLRIDESLFPPDANITLPFDSIDLYIHQIGNPFADAVASVFSVMDDSGFLGAIDQSVFTDAPASAAGLLVVPDMEELISTIEGWTGGEDGGEFLPLAEDPSLDRFLTAQMPNITGSLAIAAAGYLGDQVVDSETTSIGIKELLGADAAFSPLETGLSMVILQVPSGINITSYSPSAENASYYNQDDAMVMWNATYFGEQSDYEIFFESDEFPPPISIERSFNPTSVSVGGTVDVTVTVANEGTLPIQNLSLSDLGIGALYSTVTVSGDQELQALELDGGDSVSITYSVTFPNEGSYTFPKATLLYEYDGVTYEKKGKTNSVVVSADPVSVLSRAISDGWPYTGGVIGLVAIVGIWQIVGLVRGSKSGGGQYYEV